MPLLEIHGGQLYYEEAGAGPDVVLVHAGIADHRMWEPQWAALADRFHLVRYDTRGYGRTVGSDVPYSNRADLLALLDHLGIERAALIGCSRGGQIAADFTLEHPERVNALVLVCAGLGGMAYEPDEEEPFGEQAEAAEEAGDWERVIDLDIRIWVDGFHRPASPEAEARLAPIRALVRQMERDSVAHNSEGGQPIVLAPPAVGRLSEITVPALVLCGDYDTGMSKRSAAGFAAGISGARFERLPTAHLPNLELPGEFNRLVGGFLGEALG